MRLKGSKSHRLRYIRDDITREVEYSTNSVESGSMRGLEANFARESLLSGTCTGCSVYFPLPLEERIACAWLSIVDIACLIFTAPALTVSALISSVIVANTLLRFRPRSEESYTFGSFI